MVKKDSLLGFRFSSESAPYSYKMMMMMKVMMMMKKVNQNLTKIT